MIKLTETEADKIRGIYKPNHSCEPVYVEDGFYILHEEIKEVPELKKKLDFKLLKRFTIGDKSAENLKYQKWQIKQNLLNS